MFTFEQIKEYTNGTIINGDINTVIEEYNVSDKKFKKDDFYIPIIFRKNNEVNIIRAVENGSIGFMIDKNSDNYNDIINSALNYNPNLCILAVENVNTALYNLGLKSRELNIKKEVIAVTGSYGKTTLSSLISNILKTEMKVLHDQKGTNYNTRWHVSTLLQYFEHYDIAVLELGIADIGIMEQLSRLVEPSIAVINSIGTAHIDNIKTKQNVLNEKMHIIDYLKDKKILYVNSDDEYLQTVKGSNDYTLEKYSLNEAWNIEENVNGISFTTKIYGNDVSFSLNLYGMHHIRNIVLAIQIAEIYKIKADNIIKAINEFKPVKGRFKVLKNSERNITVIDDTYNSCFESVTYGLELASKMKSKRKIAVLGTIGAGPNGKEDTSKLHENVGEYFSNLNFDYLYVAGDYTKHTYKGALKVFPEKNMQRFKTKELLIDKLEENIQDGDLIYIKDGGLQDFEEIIYALVNKYNLT